MKRYRLIKEISDPRWKRPIGTIVEQQIEGNAYLDSEGKMAFAPNIVENNPEWFEEIKEEELIRVINGDKWFRIIGNGRDIQFTNQEALKILAAYHDNTNSWSDNDMIEFGNEVFRIAHLNYGVPTKKIFDDFKNTKSCK